MWTTDALEIFFRKMERERGIHLPPWNRARVRRQFALEQAAKCLSEAEQICTEIERLREQANQAVQSARVWQDAATCFSFAISKTEN